MQINVINRLTFNMTKEEKMEDNTLNQNESSELEKLEQERLNVIRTWLVMRHGISTVKIISMDAL